MPITRVQAKRLTTRLFVTGNEPNSLGNPNQPPHAPDPCPSARTPASPLSGVLVLAARRQGCWESFGCWLIEQAPNRNSQHLRHALQAGDGHVLRAALDAANIGPVNTCLQGKPLLRHAAFNAQRAQVPANCSSDIHDDPMEHLHGLTIDGLLIPDYINTTSWGGSIRAPCSSPKAVALGRAMLGHRRRSVPCAALGPVGQQTTWQRPDRPLAGPCRPLQHQQPDTYHPTNNKAVT